jgi:hypothetical protein
MTGPDFKTILDLPPETVAKMTGGKVKLKKPVPVPMKIGGTWDKPEVTGVDVGDLIKAVRARRQGRRGCRLGHHEGRRRQGEGQGG